MMKYLAILATVLLTSLGAVGQAFVQRTNGTFTPVDPFLSVSKTLYIPRTCDTTNALKGGRDTVGAIVWDTCNHTFWIRDTVPGAHKWVSLLNTSQQSVRWCNVVNDGADSTGTVDASVYVQSLINAGCRYIYLPKGQYLFSNTIQMKDSVTIKGDGRNNTIIKLTTDIPAFHTGHNGQYAQFLDFAIKGTKSTGATTTQIGIKCDSTGSVYIHNVGGYNLGGFGITFFEDIYNRPYPGTGLVGSIVSDCNFESCYGGIKLDKDAEYIGISNSVFVANTYGVHVMGGNSRISNCNMSSNTYGIYMTYGSNGHHGVVANCNINHCTYNIYMDSVVAGHSFVGNMIYAGTNQLYIEDCKNIEFLGGDLVGTGTATFLNNDTTIHFLDVNMRTKPTWAITGNKPTIISTREAPNSLSMFDAVNNKRFDMSYDNDTTQFAGPNLYLFKVPQARVRIGAATTSTHKLIVNRLDYTSTDRTNIASGPHLSNGVSNTFHDLDTVTSVNINNSLLFPIRLAHFQKRVRVLDDGLTFSNTKSIFAALLFNANNSATFVNNGDLQPAGVDGALFLGQYPGFAGTTTFTGTATAFNPPSCIQARYNSTNNGGSTIVNATGYYAGLDVSVLISTRDTLDKFTAINTGSKNGSGINKTFYHHYMHTNPGQENWGIYQEGSTVKNYFQGIVGINTNTPLYGLHVNRSIGQNKDSSEIVSSITSESIQLIDTLTGKFKRIAKSNFYITGSATLDFPNTVAGASSDLTVTVTGAVDGDVVAIGVPNGSTVANGCFTAWVSGANTVTIRYSNNDLTNALNPASGTFKATIIKH